MPSAAAVPANVPASAAPVAVQPPEPPLGQGLSSITSPGAPSMSGLTNVTHSALPASASSTVPSVLSSSKANSQLPAEALMAITMLKYSMIHTPENIDNDKHSSYAPRNPYPNAHPSFPQVPPPQLENAALFERLPVDALFFAFYNQPGSYQQYLAAKQLKKHSWRFHKKYMTWFQRHEEPKITTEDYEEGTYVYFDYESGWCQRIKSEFKFEYAYLEDEVQSNS
jgi:CCR4-NOT transcription complex subunit 3